MCPSRFEKTGNEVKRLRAATLVEGTKHGELAVGPLCAVKLRRTYEAIQCANQTESKAPRHVCV